MRKFNSDMIQPGPYNEEDWYLINDEDENTILEEFYFNDFILEDHGNGCIVVKKGPVFSYSLTSDDFPAGVTIIGEHAFKRYDHLLSIEIPDSVRVIGVGAFSECRGLTSFEIPNSVTNIDEYAFYGCLNLTSIKISDNAEYIGNHAFGYCTALESIKIPDSVTSIGEYAFHGCPLLTIYASKGSAAEEYARKNNIKFIEE